LLLRVQNGTGIFDLMSIFVYLLRRNQNTRISLGCNVLINVS